MSGDDDREPTTGDLTPGPAGTDGGGPPERVGPFVIEGVLGRGGHGVVYRGRDPRSGRTVALKALPPGLAADAARRGVLEREAALLALVDHPNVAVLHGIEEAAEGLYLVIELVEGESLRARLDRGPLGLDEALRVALQVADGLGAAHERRIVHRDLKPRNVLLRPDGVVKLVDLGVAARLERPGDGPERARETVGTLPYMSPEQLAGAPPAVATDVWAFGCLLFELLTGSKAWTGSDERERVRRIRFEPAPLEALPAGTPVRVRELVAACLAKEPASRPASMPAIRDLVLATLQQLGVVLAPSVVTPAVRGNLPHRLGRLVGRRAELEALERQLAVPGLVTLVGAGGSGKTRLALEVAWRAGAGHPDGAWLVDLAAIGTDAAVADQAAATLGIHDRPGTSRVEAVVTWARLRQAVLVLDNCGHVPGGAADLARALLEGAPQARVLATSRSPLGVEGERVVSLEPLELPAEGRELALEVLERVAAVELFVERAAEARPGFALDEESRSGVLEICRRLDGLPLALELAAARLRWMPLATLVASLDQRLRLLESASPLRPDRHHTLSALVAWSYDHLAERERALLRRLAVFAGSLSLEAAEEVGVGGAVAAGDVPAALALLRQRSLLAEERRERGVRYRLLETVRAFAAARLEQSGEEGETHRRHVRHYARVAALAAPGLRGPEQVVWYQRLLAEHENLRVALAASRQDRELHRTGLGLAADLAGYFRWRGLSGEGRAALEAALDLPVGDRPLERARAHDDCGLLCLDLGDLDGAEQHLRAGLAQARSCGSAVQAASCWNGLGHLAQLRADNVRARLAFGFGLDLALRAGDPHETARSLQNLGSALEQGGDIDTACWCREQSLVLWRQIGDRRSEAVALSNLGVTVSRERDAVLGKELQTRALALRRELGDERGIAVSLTNLGMSLLQLGERDECRRVTTEAFEHMRRIGQPEGMLVTANNLGAADEEEGNLTGARGWYARALRTAQAGGVRTYVPPLLENFASLEKAAGRWPRVPLLLGAATALRSRWSLPVSSTQLQVIAEAEAGARAALGAEAFECAFAEGSALELAPACALALGGDPQAGTQA